MVLVFLESFVLTITIFLHSSSHWSILAHLMSCNLFDLLVMIDLALKVSLALQITYLSVELEEDIVSLEMLCFSNCQWTAVPLDYTAYKEVITWFLLQHVWMLHQHSFTVFRLILLSNKVIFLVAFLPCPLVAIEKCLSTTRGLRLN